jgi:hypothetical protein
MSDGPFYPYIGLLILSGVLLAVMAAAGFGQARGARLVDALFAAGFLGYAAYLWIANPDTVEIFFYAFAVPVFAVINVVRSRRHRRASGHPQQAAAFAPSAAGPAQPPGFSSAAALFAPPKQEVRPEVPAIDPGSYRSMPSGLAGHDVHEQALPSARPSGLPAAQQETFPMAPTAPGTSPSGLPRRVPTYSEPAPADQPAHVEFTQRLVHPGPAPVPDEPAGPQPLYPAGAAEPWRSDLTQQFEATPAGPSERPSGEDHTMMGHHQYERAPGGQAAQEQQRGRHGYSAPAERTGRHGYPDDEPTGGHHWRQDPEPFDQPAYYPAHGEQQPGDGVYGSPAYPRESGRHEQQDNHPADWPPFPR